VLLPLAVVALVSLAAGGYNAVIDSSDFQYSNACRFIAGGDPFAEHLASPDRDTPAARALAPVYLHYFYFLLAPLCLVTWQTAAVTWLIANVAFAAGAVHLLARRAGLGGRARALIFCLFVISTPMRNTLGIGQTSLFILFVFVFAFLAPHPAGRRLASVLSFIKYSFVGSWAGLMLRREPATVIWSGAIALVLVGVSSWWLADGDLRHALFAPLTVARTSVAVGHGDLMAVFHYAVDPDQRHRLELALVLLAANVLLVYGLARLTADPTVQLAMASTASLLFLNHLIYDSVFLLPALVLFVARRDPYAVVGGVAIGLHWYGLRVVDFLNLRTESLEWTLAVAALYATVLACVVASGSRRSGAAPEAVASPPSG